MKLIRAEIQNYRSVENLNLSFTNGCEILIGVNESGKSNILRALSLLDPSATVSANDLRIERKSEAPTTRGHVRFVFKLDEPELDEIYEVVKKQFILESLDSPLIVTNNQSLTLREFVHKFDEGLYIAELPGGSRRASYWSLPANKFILIDGWKRLKGQSGVSLATKDDKVILSDENKAIQTALLKVLDSIAYEPLTVADIHSAIGKEVNRIVNAKLPKCVYWNYSEQFLLPSSINVNEFIANPDTCIPLKSMFELAGIKSEDVAETISTAKQQPIHRYIHLLDKVASAATTHVHDVWKEHKGIQITLRAHGDLLVPMIQDKDVPLDMANRSEGFKRFVSFLLLISAKVRTKQLTGNLILVDEPEIGLHPRGARNLMSELVKIGESNTTVYTTHSIFMVDRDCIERHLIVEKKDEVTTTWRASKSRIQDEEVLYSAIGYSIFETLHEKNVIFEGWRDKQVFRVARDFILKDSKDLKSTFESIGLTFAEGVKDVRHVARFLELANRGCLIISDADAAGLQHQKEYRRENGWGTWLTLQDILGAGPIVTAEDLLASEYVIRKANNLRKGRPKLSELTAANLAVAEPALTSLTKWLQSAVTNDEPLNDLLVELKNSLFEKLKREDIREEVRKLVEFVAKHDFSGK